MLIAEPNDLHHNINKLKKKHRIIKDLIIKFMDTQLAIILLKIYNSIKNLIVIFVYAFMYNNHIQAECHLYILLLLCVTHIF